MPATHAATTRSRRAAPLAVLLLALLLALPAAPAHAADSGREDYTFGTTHEGMDMGRDPDTGDEYMRASPPEQPQDQQQPIIIQPEVRPEVVLPGHDRHEGRGHHGHDGMNDDDRPDGGDQN